MCRPCRRERREALTGPGRAFTGRCQHCGGPAERVYCSRTCSNRATAKATGLYDRRPCEVCGDEYKPKKLPGSAGVTRTCGRACGGELQRRAAVLRRANRAPAPPTTCATCGRVISARRRYCDDVMCRPPRGKYRVGVEYDVECPVCAAPMKWVGTRGGAIGACADCVRARKRAERARQRARARAGECRPHKLYPLIPLPLVGDRDNWTCGICLGPVDGSLVVPDSWAPTLDHVVPLAVKDGPGHVLWNVQLAHFLCNSVKSDALPTEAEVQRVQLLAGVVTLAELMAAAS